MPAAGHMSERPCTQLLERLTAGEVFAVHDRRIQDPLFEGDSVPACFQDIMDADREKAEGEALDIREIYGAAVALQREPFESAFMPAARKILPSALSLQI